MSTAAETWQEPPTESEAAEGQPNPPESKPLADLKRREADDPTELLRIGYLCRG